MSKYPLSKWLIQACPPDMSESRVDARWGFGVYEVLDRRRNPMDPRVLHSIYRGAIELSAEDARTYLEKAYESAWADIIEKEPDRGPAFRKLLVNEELLAQ